MSTQATPVEHIKERSRGLRGSIEDSLADAATGALAEDDTHLVKFHGFYQQDDRDLRGERLAQKLEPAHSFMIRVRVPGGQVTPQQWLAMDALARQYATRPLRLTTRQAFELHGIIKRELKPSMAGINACLLDTLAACGDVNRNVMCSSLPELSTPHRHACEMACAIGRHLTPRTTAYQEIWLDGRKLEPGEEEAEPIYGRTYLPRKFKIAVAVPPINDVDVFAHDLGFIAVSQGQELLGYNVCVGGGMGMTHGEPATYPRLAELIGFCTPEQAITVAEQVVTIQRDFGDRTNRKRARLKYTIDERGLDWFRDELRARLGFSLSVTHPYEFTHRGDHIGWCQDASGLWHLTLFIPEGRIRDDTTCQLATGLAAIARVHRGDFRLTPNQNVAIARIPPKQRPVIEALLEEHGLDTLLGVSRMRQQALACVAFPSCPLAFAEAERYLPHFSARLQAVLDEEGLSDEPISVRLSGCANGCSRPHVAEIALIGKAPGHYNLMLGGSALGDRMNQMVLENADETRILEHLQGLLRRFSRERTPGESFGDFSHRTALENGTTGS